MITIDSLQHPMGSFSLQVGSLRLKPGLTLLVGPNGAGKTTLLELLATVQMPKRGTIMYQQRSAADDLPLVRSQIGYVPAEIELYEDMTPLKLLAYLSELKGVFRLDRAKGLLHDFRLEDWQKTRISHLSQGIRRRLAIAQALLAAPVFLFLDEPLNGMDSGERKLAISYLNRYAAGRTVIAAVHEMNEWEGAADRVIWLEGGKVKFEGRTSLWTADLPHRIWEGTITVEQFKSYPTHGLIIFREVEEGIYVKLVSDTPPFPGLTEVPPMLEDAYFVRKYSISAML